MHVCTSMYIQLALSAWTTVKVCNVSIQSLNYSIQYISILIRQLVNSFHSTSASHTVPTTSLIKWNSSTIKTKQDLLKWINNTGLSPYAAADLSIKGSVKAASCQQPVPPQAKVIPARAKSIHTSITRPA